MGQVVGVPSLNVCVHDLFAGELYLGRVEAGE